MEYRQHRERISEFTDSEYLGKTTQDILKHAYYGAASLATLEESQNNPGETERYARTWIRIDIMALFNYGSGKTGLTLCTETWSQPAIQAGWEQLFNDEKILYSPPLTPEFVWENVTHNSELLQHFPGDFAEQLLRAHVDHMNKLQGEFEVNELPTIMTEVDEKIIRAINNQILPITIDQWQHIKDNTKIIVMDTIKGEEIGGNANGPVISITSQASLAEKTHIAIHEFIHRLNGSIIKKTTTTGTPKYGDPETDIDYNNVRSGLLFTTPFYRTPKRQWINEAVTEDTALAVDNQEYSEYYEAERQLLELLVQSLGPSSRELLRTVYFEDPGVEAEKNLTEYRALTRLVLEKLGPGFLNNLEKFIHGQRGNDGTTVDPSTAAEIAAKKWQKLGLHFPEYLTEWCRQQGEITQLALGLIESVKTENPEALSKLDKYSSPHAYEEVWKTYFKAKIPKPSQYLTATLHDLVIKKLTYTTTRAAYRTKFGIEPKDPLTDYIG